MGKGKKWRKSLPVVAVCLLAIALVGALWAERRHDRLLRQELEELNGQKEGLTIPWNGRRYYLRTDVETVLLIGIDDTSDNPNQSDGKGYQCDFVTLLVVDHGEKSYRLLQLNRDTMCNVNVLSPNGRAELSRWEQLALSHAYGDGGSGSCRNVAETVHNLLYGVGVYDYVRVGVSAIPVLNDLVGGVRVTLEEDFSSFDPAMTRGTTLTLKGRQAEIFVRARMGMENPTNLARMKRQRVYLQGWLDAAVRSATAEDGERFFKALGGKVLSNLSVYQLSALAEVLQSYENRGILTTEGESRLGEEFMEFELNEDAFRRQVIDLFFAETEGA